MEQDQYRSEIQEAIDAADHALYSLDRARDSLLSAKGWGIFDLFGGGFISTWAKHSKMNEAEKSLADVQAALREFSKELDDVDEMIDLSFNSVDLLTFADYFLDGFFADFLMQGRINDAIWNVDNTIDQVTTIRNALQQKLLP